MPVKVTVADIETTEVIATTVCFAVAEALTNALKHAHATGAAVLGRIGPGTVRRTERTGALGHSGRLCPAGHAELGRRHAMIARGGDPLLLACVATVMAGVTG